MMKLRNQNTQQKNTIKKSLKNFSKMIFSEILFAGASTISSSTLAIVNPSAGFILSSSTALLTSIVVLVTYEYISN